MWIWTILYRYDSGIANQKHQLGLESLCFLVRDCIHRPMLMQELRRGSGPAAIYSMAFSKGCDWLAVSSDKGTVHVFALNDALRNGAKQVRRHMNGIGNDGVNSSQANPTTVLSVVKVSMVG